MRRASAVRSTARVRAARSFSTSPRFSPSDKVVSASRQRAAFTWAAKSES